MVKKFFNSLESDFSNLFCFENQPTEIFDKWIRTFKSLNTIDFEFESNYAEKVCCPVVVIVDLLGKRISGTEELKNSFFVFLPDWVELNILDK
jgi:hypothetical protein